MKIRLFNNQEEIGKRLYYCTFVYASILSFLLASNYVPMIPSKMVHRLIYLAIVALFVKIYALDYCNLKEIIGKSMVLILAIISWRLSRNTDILLYVSFILGARNVNFREIIKLFFVTIGILLLGTIIISQANLVKDAVYMRKDFHRHSLGIGYPTDTGAYAFYLLLAYYYLFFKNLTWRSYAIVAFLDVVLYEVTQARNSCVLILLTIPIIWVAQLASNGNVISRGIASFYWMIAPLAAYSTLLLAWLYNPSRIFNILDRILSGRLGLSHKALAKYGISFFGQHVHENGWGGVKGLKNFYKLNFSYFYIDSSYMRLVIIYGLILGVLIVICMTAIAYRSTLNREYALAAIIMLIGLHCIVEQHLLDLSYNPFLFALLAVVPMLTINKKIDKSGGNHDSK
ncbi:hypothetical protein [Limosilactobacillus viscerum]|uniref:hypothetical protein n=1 Tax=Limosilactobacillus viscerum TaxID=2993450 RepID=UPI0024BB5CB8|nr:hypothetical protein [Limosilactobacillus viscerum]